MRQDKYFVRFTEIYIFALFAFFLFVPPIHKGYTRFADFTYGAFLVVCGGYVIASLARLSFLWITGRVCFRLSQLKCLPVCACLLFAYGALCLVSLLLSPYAPHAIVGHFRYGGFLTMFILLCGCFFVYLFYRPKKYHLYLFIVAILLYCAVGILQLMGKNPLYLYPSYNFYSAVPLHKSVFFSTSGNADHGGAVLSMAIGILCGFLLLKNKKICLIPLFFCLLCTLSLTVDALLVALIAGLFLLFPVAFSFGLRHGISFYCLFAALTISCFFFSFSENGMDFTVNKQYFLFLPLLLVGLIFMKKTTPSPVRRALFIPLILFCVGGLLFIKFYPISFPDFLRQAHLMFNGKFDDTFGSGRLYIWKQSIPFLWDRPLFGVGPDCVGFLPYEPFVTYDEALNKTFTASITAAHNQYLHIALCQGFLGLFAYLALLFCVLKKSMGAFSCPHAQIAAFGVLFYSIQAFFGIDFISTAPLFWTLFGIAMQASSQK